MANLHEDGPLLGLSLSTLFLGMTGGVAIGMILMGHIIANKMPSTESNQMNCSQRIQTEDRIKTPLPN